MVSNCTHLARMTIASRRRKKSGNARRLFGKNLSPECGGNSRTKASGLSFGRWSQPSASAAPPVYPSSHRRRRRAPFAMTPARKHAAGTAEREAVLVKAVRPYSAIGRIRGAVTHTPAFVFTMFGVTSAYTWSIPQTPNPGRKLLYLVRDGAHSSHAVIGIAALCQLCRSDGFSDDSSVGALKGLRSALKALLATAKDRKSMEESDKFLKFQGIYHRWRPSVTDQVIRLPAKRPNF